MPTSAELLAMLARKRSHCARCGKALAGSQRYYCSRTCYNAFHDEIERQEFIEAKPPPLPPGYPKQKRCLGCDEWFRSTGLGHRLCRKCNLRNQGLPPKRPILHGPGGVGADFLH